MNIVIVQTGIGVQHIGPFKTPTDAEAWLRARPDTPGIVVPLIALTGAFAEAPEGATFHFGKYNGRTIESVMRENPQYIVWAYGAIEGHAGITEAQYRKAGGTVFPKAPQARVRPLPPPAARDFGDDFADDDIPF